MGALMVIDPQPATRYQPAEPYINRTAPRNRGGQKRKGREGRDERNQNTKLPAEFLSS
jgi:hypothetical protein